MMAQWSGTMLAIVLNVLLSVALVIQNKKLVVKYEFDFMSMLTGLHFLASMLVTILLVVAGVIKFKPVKNYFHIFRIALGSLLSTVFMNYCLSSSSIGFYQISKLGCIPLTLLLETLLGFRQQRLTLSLLASLLLIVVGMLAIVRQEIVYSETGLFWAVAGVVTTTVAQIFFAPLKRDLDLDSLQLLFHTAPWLTFGSFATVPAIESLEVMFNYALDEEIMVAIALSCIIAVAFNMSNYAVLSRVSPLSYTVLGHVKTLAIILVGSYMFQSWPSGPMAVGMALAVTGVGLYTTECEAQNRSKASSLSNDLFGQFQGDAAASRGVGAISSSSSSSNSSV